MDFYQGFPQSVDGQLTVVNTTKGAMWQVCWRGTCLQAHSGARLMEQYRALLISKGLVVPPG